MSVAKQLVVVSASSQNSGQFSTPVTLWNPDGTVLSVVGQTSAGLVITGYAIAGAAAALAATDTLNVALGKLEKNTAVKQAAAQADFAGADITALKVELNAFLAKLRTATLVAP